MKNDPPVIFIHGFIGTFHVPQFEREYVSPDLLGYGEHRSVPPDQITLPAQVEHIRRFVKARFGTRPVDVVGHSVGGAIAMLFAHAYPENVRQIINIEGNFTLEDAFWSASVGRMTPDEAEAMLDGFPRRPACLVERRSRRAHAGHAGRCHSPAGSSAGFNPARNGQIRFGDDQWC